jgi:methylthioribose-1-phosphate isomerase
MIDQTRIPRELAYVSFKNYRQVAEAIRSMVVRGAPAIGAATAMGLALAANSSHADTKAQLIQELETAALVFRGSRPTAWNLFWATDRILKKAQAAAGSPREIAAQVVSEALAMAEEDIWSNRKIGEYGAKILDDGDCVLTHCNAGTLATVSYGTALAPIRTAISQGKKIRVIATETRPRLQGARLTTYELLLDEIPVTLIVDGAVGYVMKKGLVKTAIVGADRITREYVVNKVGTYLVALAAQANQIPFYVAAPASTFDLRPKQDEVEIEERSSQEVTHIGGKRIVPEGVAVLNPAFDLTPLDLVNGFITEKGIVAADRVRAGLLVA